MGRRLGENTRGGLGEIKRVEKTSCGKMPSTVGDGRDEASCLGLSLGQESLTH